MLFHSLQLIASQSGEGSKRFVTLYYFCAVVLCANDIIDITSNQGVYTIFLCSKEGQFDQFDIKVFCQIMYKNLTNELLKC